MPWSAKEDGSIEKDYAPCHSWSQKELRTLSLYGSNFYLRMGSKKKTRNQARLLKSWINVSFQDNKAGKETKPETSFFHFFCPQYYKGFNCSTQKIWRKDWVRPWSVSKSFTARRTCAIHCLWEVHTDDFLYKCSLLLGKVLLFFHLMNSVL